MALRVIEDFWMLEPVEGWERDPELFFFGPDAGAIEQVLLRAGPRLQRVTNLTGEELLERDDDEGQPWDDRGSTPNYVSTPRRLDDGWSVYVDTKCSVGAAQAATMLRILAEEFAAAGVEAYLREPPGSSRPRPPGSSGFPTREERAARLPEFASLVHGRDEVTELLQEMLDDLDAGVRWVNNDLASFLRQLRYLLMSVERGWIMAGREAPATTWPLLASALRDARFAS